MRLLTIFALLILWGGFTNAVLAAPITLQPELYGKFTINIRADNNDVFKLNSNSSRIGVRGNDSVSGIYYQGEFGVAVDDGDSGNDRVFSQRNILLGINTIVGKFQAGLFDLPSKKFVREFDVYNDNIADAKYVLNGMNRTGETIAWKSRKLGGLKIFATTILGEGTQDNTGLFDSVDISAIWKSKLFKIGANISNNVLSSSLEKDYLNIINFLAGAKFGNLGIDVLYQSSSEGNSYSFEDEVSANQGTNTVATSHIAYDLVGYGLAVKYSIDSNWVLKIQLLTSETEKTYRDATTVTSSGTAVSTTDRVVVNEYKSSTLGLDYKVNKQLTYFAFISEHTNNDYAAIGVTYKF